MVSRTHGTCLQSIRIVYLHLRLTLTNLYNLYDDDVDDGFIHWRSTSTSCWNGPRLESPFPIPAKQFGLRFPEINFSESQENSTLCWKSVTDDTSEVTTSWCHKNKYNYFYYYYHDTVNISLTSGK